MILKIVHVLTGNRYDVRDVATDTLVQVCSTYEMAKEYVKLHGDNDVLFEQFKVTF